MAGTKRNRQTDKKIGGKGNNIDDITLLIAKWIILNGLAKTKGGLKK